MLLLFCLTVITIIIISMIIIIAIIIITTYSYRYIFIVNLIIVLISYVSEINYLSIYLSVSSANKIENNKSDDLEKSLTLRIHNRGPNIDPCGLCELCF